MKASWTLAALTLSALLTLSAVAQNDPGPELKTRPRDPGAQAGTASTSDSYGNTNTVQPGPPNAIPEGTRFIIRLRDTVDTARMEQGEPFRAELREDLVTPNGLIIPRGHSIKGHVGSFEHGYTGARLLLVLDEIETRKGWVPLIGVITGVPGDSSIKSSENEGELLRKGADVRRAVTEAAIGAGVGAATGATVGGSKAAAIGAATGAGLGAGAGLLSRREIRLMKDTQLEVRLDRNLIVPTRREEKHIDPDDQRDHDRDHGHD